MSNETLIDILIDPSIEHNTNNNESDNNSSQSILNSIENNVSIPDNGLNLDLSGNIINEVVQENNIQQLKNLRLKQYNEKKQEYINIYTNSNNASHKFLDILIYNTKSSYRIFKIIGTIFRESLFYSFKICVSLIALTIFTIMSSFDLITYTILNSFPELLAIIIYSIISIQYKFKPEITNGMIGMFSAYSCIFSHSFIVLNTCDCPSLSEKVLKLFMHSIKLTEVALQIFYTIEFNKVFTDNYILTLLLSLIPFITLAYYILMPIYLIKYCKNLKLLSYYEQKDKIEELNDIINKKYGNVIIKSFIKLTEHDLSEHKCENDDCKDCECCICYAKDNNKFIITKCKHIFHIDCLEKWINTDVLQNQEFSCPMCRADLFENNIVK